MLDTHRDSREVWGSLGDYMGHKPRDIFVLGTKGPPRCDCWHKVQIFKHILCPLMPTWPIAPSKDIESRCWEDPVLVESLPGWK
eukprot:6454568-Amphidinium_carterae.1